MTPTAPEMKITAEVNVTPPDSGKINILDMPIAQN